MVKTLLSIFISLALLVGAAVFETFYVGAQFDKFGDALETLEIKVRDESATRGDAEAVREVWETEKKKPALRHSAQRHLLHRLLDGRGGQLHRNEEFRRRTLQNRGAYHHLRANPADLFGIPRKHLIARTKID